MNNSYHSKEIRSSKEEINKTIDVEKNSNLKKIPPLAVKKRFSRNCEIKDFDGEEGIENESIFKFSATCFFTIAAAGIGMAIAGRFLELGQKSYLFTSYPTLIAVFPPLVGMKGNIEMTLASRLGTLVNKNMLNFDREAFKHVIPNIAVVSVQSIILATLATFVVNLISIKSIIFDDMAIVYGISVGTALIASTILSYIVVIGVFVAKFLNYDPDNIVGPIAACLGDAITVIIMMYYGQIIDNYYQNYSWVPLVCLVTIYLWSIIMIPIAWQYPKTRLVLKFGWFSTVIAMLLSSVSGLFLSLSAQIASYVAAFQPILNGLSGNVGAIQAAKISTLLEIKYPDHIFEKEYKIFSYFLPYKLFNIKERESCQALILLIISIVCQCFLVPVAHAFMGFENDIPFMFNVFYIIASICLVLTLLYISQWICRLLWFYGYSADDNSIPIITAFGDLMGSILMFSILHIIYKGTLPVIEGES